MMSFKVVTNGPIAKAGSILYRFKIKGNNVPKIAANKMTVNKETLTTTPNSEFSNTDATPKIKLARKIPFINPTLASRHNFGKILPKSLSPRAKDCTTIAEDCTPTFPPIAVIPSQPI